MKNRALLLFGGAILLAACAESTGPPPEPLVITTQNLPNGLLDVPYDEGVSATGGTLDYTWELEDGVLPPGLVLNLEDLRGGDDLLITGTPSQAGSYDFTLQVTSEDGQTDTESYTILIDLPEALTIENLFLPPALAGAPYNVPLRPRGGLSADYEWAIVSGTLPAGLTLTADGRIEGTPTTPDTTTITVEVRSGAETYSMQFEIPVVADQPGVYNLTPVFVRSVPASIRPHVAAAIAQWEDVLTADLAPGTLPSDLFGEGGCGGYGADVNGTSLDDLIVLINITSIDGPGQVLGQAGPCATRPSNDLPAVGILTLDYDDLGPMTGSQTLTHILSHEIGHVLGFGSLWGEDLLMGRGGADPRFTGPEAVREWTNLGGTGNVPVESQGGQGTAGSHWRESVFDRELMTGFSEALGVFQPLSRVTIGAMADLGYEVDYAAADPYTLGISLLAPDAERPNLGYDIVLHMPPRFIREIGPADPLKRRGVR